MMIRFSKSLLLMSAAILALNACSSDKGPGKIGTVSDIKVTNNGLPGAKTAEQPAAPTAQQAGDFSTTVEQGQAVPAPEVGAAEQIPAPIDSATAHAEPLPDNSPAMKQAVEQQQAANAPVPSMTGSQPPDLSSAPVSETRPLDAVAPTEPVNATVTPPPSDTPPTATSTPPAAASTGVYPTSDYPSAATAPASAAVAPSTNAPVAAPVAASSSPAKYPLDPNAPYSPKAMAEAAARAGTPVTAPEMTKSGINLADPALIRSTQAALAAKGKFVGAQTGIMDAELLNAITRYQAENKLPQGGLNEATLRQLGIIE